MEITRGILTKSIAGHCEHFLQRLHERYSLIISETEYSLLHLSFRGKFKKSSNKTIGWVNIHGTKVWCLYYNDLECLATCYPPEIEHNDLELMRACFGPTLRPIAKSIYDAYINERSTVREDFETIKDAAIHYFSNTLFPTLHIDVYKYSSVCPFKVMAQISRILNGTSQYVTLTPVRVIN